MHEISNAERYRYSATAKVLFVAVPVALLAAVVWVPSLLVHMDSAGQSLDTVQRVKAMGQARQMVLQAIGGMVVLLGAYIGYRRLRVNEAELQVSRDGQVTERFTRAVEQLGAESADVRIGGIHALERISRNSPADRDAVFAILSAFVRSHSPWPATETNSVPSNAPVPTLGTRRADVQSAVLVLGSIPRSVNGEIPRLVKADLRRARMWGLNFDRAMFSLSSLRDARMGGCSLVDADLGHCDLREADLVGADLTGAQLWSADLTDAILTDATLRHAKYDANTKWPVKFDLGQYDLIEVSDARAFYRRY